LTVALFFSLRSVLPRSNNDIMQITTELLDDPDDTPEEIVLASLQRAIEDAQAGCVISIEELWGEVESEKLKPNFQDE
jgi:hypothetical protein